MRDVIIEVIGSIKRNRLRTALTGFSVAWGIFMLIVLLGAGNGMKNSMTANIGSVNLNTMEVYGGWTSKPYDGFEKGRIISLDDKDVKLTEDDAFADVIDEVTPTVAQSGINLSYGKRHASVSFQGCYPEIKEMIKLNLIEGRFLNVKDVEEKRKVIVIPADLAQSLFRVDKSYSQVIGKSVKAGTTTYKVIGVYKTDGMSMGYEAFIPYSTLKAIYQKGKFVDDIMFSFHGLSDEEDNEAFEKRYRAALNTNHRADPTDTRAVRISNHFTQNSQMDKAMRAVTIFLWIVGLFTLLSGIVGVSNIMLITVRERTHEFGIRKAIGAAPWDVTKLIIAESVSITALFGYIGMFAGMLACKIMDMKMGSSETEVLGQKITMFVDPTVGLDVALEATLLLIIAGTVAGLVPAIKATKVRPIEALRADR